MPVIETQPGLQRQQNTFQPLISIIIPVYNAEVYIKSTIKSVLCQTYTNFEIVVVDDGGTDESIRLIEALNDPRIRIIRQPNQGVSVARNNGVAAAKGDYIAFLDSDDLWYPN